MSWSSNEGTKIEKQGKVMWQREYFEWAQTTQGGNLTQEEMEDDWRPSGGRDISEKHFHSRWFLVC
eukprot:3237002-Prorocentrum_lima.AAC.1